MEFGLGVGAAARSAGLLGRAWWCLRSQVATDEGRAWLCDWDHPLASFVGDPMGTSSRHLDVKVKLWNRGPTPITVMGVKSAAASGQRLRAGDLVTWNDVTLPPDGTRREIYFSLQSEEPLAAQVGNELKVKFALSHGGRRFPVLRLPIAATEQG